MSEPVITVAIDSGANCQSCHEHEVSAADLGFESHEEWGQATEEEKCKAVTEYWQGNGHPEIWWEEAAS